MITIAGEPSEHRPNARQSDERDGGLVEVFVVLGQAPAAVDPGQEPVLGLARGALDDPASWDDLETLGLRGTLSHASRISFRNNHTFRAEYSMILPMKFLFHRRRTFWEPWSGKSGALVA